MDYWARTTLKLSALNEFVNDRVCKANQNSFISCVRALQSIVNAQVDSKKNWILMPEELAAKKEKATLKILETISPFVVVEQIKPPGVFSQNSALAEKQFIIAERTAEIDSLIKIFAEKEVVAKFDFDSTLSLLEKNYFDFTHEQLFTGLALNAFLGSFQDPHTYILPREEAEAFRTGDQDSYAGIGIGLDAAPGGNGAVIRSLIKNGAADQAGLKIDDRILKVDQAELRTRTVEELNATIKSIRGPVGSSIELEVLRVSQPLHVKIKRIMTVIQNVNSRIVQHSGVAFGYISIGQFSGHTCDDVYSALHALKASQVKGFILDVRGNPGGAVEEAVCVGSLFVGNQVIVKIVDPRHPDSKYIGSYNSSPEAAQPQSRLPVALLQNSVSASAAEILAGALQDYRRAWIIGDRSFGKGSEQLVHPVQLTQNEDIMIAETTNLFYRPLGGSNQRVGVIPDFSVPFKPDAKPDDIVAEREEDLYTNAFKNNRKPWSQPRPADVARIEICRKKDGRAAKLYEKQNGSVVDYQLAVAEDVLKCSTP